MTARAPFRSGGRGRCRLLAALAALAIGSACASYHQAAIGDLAPRDRVRLEVEDREIPALIAFAEGPTGRLHGRFVGLAGDSATFRLENAAAYRTVTLPLSSVAFLERRDTDVTRSLILSGAIVGGVGVLAYLGFEGGSDGGTPGDGGSEAFAPVFLISFPFGR